MRWQPPQASVKRRRRRWWPWAVGGLVTLGAAAAIVLLWGGSGASPPAERAISPKSFNVPTRVPTSTDPAAGSPPTPATPASPAPAITPAPAGPPLRLQPLTVLAFVRSGDIWSRSGDGPEVRLTRDGANAQPRVSGDGQWISWVKDSSEIWTSAVDGSRSRRFPGRSAVWSPATSQQAVVTVTGAVWMINGDGTGGREVLPADGSIRSLWWHPDGLRFALQSVVQDQTTGNSRVDLVLVDSQTAELAPLILAGSGTSATAAPRVVGWSSDGAALIVLQSRVTSGGTMWGLFAVTTARRVQLAPSVSTAAGGVALRGDGRMALVVRPEISPRLFQVVIRELDGALTPVGPLAETSPGWLAWSPAGDVVWSQPISDGAGVVFGRSLYRGRPGAEATRLTDGTFFDEAPQFLTDSRLLFARRTVPPAGRPSVDLFSMASDGSVERVLADLDGPPGTTLGFPRNDWDTWLSLYRPR